MSVDPDDPTVADFRAALQRLNGNRELLGEMIGFFRADVGPLLKEIAAGVRANDARRSRLASHSLKGLAASFDAHRVMDVARQIEELSDQLELAIGAPLVERLRQEVSLLLQAFDNEQMRSP